MPGELSETGLRTGLFADSVAADPFFSGCGEPASARGALEEPGLEKERFNHVFDGFFFFA